MRLQVTIAFLLGTIASLLAVLVFGQQGQPALAQSTANGVVAIHGNATPGAEQLLWLVDMRSDTPRLAVYQYQGGRLMLQVARNIKYDFQLDTYPTRSGSQKPSVEEVYKLTEASRKDSRKGE